MVKNFVYMIKCNDGTLYTGSTNDLEKRLAAHNAGTAAKYTRGRHPVFLVYVEEATTWGSALSRERAIKKLSRERKLTMITGNVTGGDVLDLKVKAQSKPQKASAQSKSQQAASVNELGQNEGLIVLPGEQAGGCLYLVPTPIGNLEDITYRALRVLREADLIAAEDTRHTRKLLTHFGIGVPLTSYHEHNKRTKGVQIIEQVMAGKKVAVVTDAGMPGISDPGHDLMVTAWEQVVPVVVLPGASASILALVLSGLRTNRFVFEGFLSSDKKHRRAQLEQLTAELGTTILYEAPHRVLKLLAELAPVLGERKIAIARELTKKFEQAVKGTAAELLEYFRQTGVKGEFVLVIEGAVSKLPGEAGEWWAKLSVEEHVEALVKDGQTKKEAIKATALARNVPKRAVYQKVMIEQEPEL